VGDQDEAKHVFVCGLHRSGTTILAQKIAAMKGCTGFEGTGVVMDEGQYLQDIFPREAEHGGVGRFGFDPRSHLTEDSALLTSANISRLRRSWEAYWDKNKSIRVEKTPGNLLKTRFLQAAFPNSYFVVIKRHPVPVSLATQKWSRTSLHSLFRHWLRCHDIFNEDKGHLTRVLELSYEEYILNPAMLLAQIARFIGTGLSDPLAESAVDAYNANYFRRWGEMLLASPFKRYYRHVAGAFEPQFQKYGYSLIPPGFPVNIWARGRRPNAAAGSLLCLGADICAFLSLARFRLKSWARGIAHRYCPDKIRAIVRSLWSRQPA
jgi:Sulfotransferase family